MARIPADCKCGLVHLSDGDVNGVEETDDGVDWLIDPADCDIWVFKDVADKDPLDTLRFSTEIFGAGGTPLVPRLTPLHLEMELLFLK